MEPIQISLENSKGNEFDGFQIILKLEICAEIVFNCGTPKKNRLLFVTFKKQRRRESALAKYIGSTHFLNLDKNCILCERGKENV